MLAAAMQNIISQSARITRNNVLSAFQANMHVRTISVVQAVKPNPIMVKPMIKDNFGVYAIFFILLMFSY